jgi:diguanylate cyclase (GGDEF)-like protein
MAHVRSPEHPPLQPLAAADLSILQRLHQQLQQRGPDVFQAAAHSLLREPTSQANWPDDTSQAQLLQLQTAYFCSLTEGPYGEGYRQGRDQMGLAMARLDLPPSWLAKAYQHYLQAVLPCMVHAQAEQPEELLRQLLALSKALMRDMGLAADALQAHRQRVSARLGSYDAAFAGLPCGTLVLTPDLTVVFANPAVENLLNLPTGSLSGSALHDWLDVASLIALAEQSFQQSLVCENLTLCRSGHPEALAIPVRATVRLLRDVPGGGEPHLLLVFEDLRQQTRLTRDLLNAQAVARVGTWQIDLATDVMVLSPQACSILNWPEDQVCTYRGLMDCIHDEDRPGVETAWQAALEGAPFRVEHRIQIGQRTRWVEARGRLEYDAQGQPLKGHGTLLDISERHLAAEHLQRLAFYDVLTGLPNRTHGLVLAQQMLDRCERAGRPLALLFLDLDRLQEINDIRGHAMGDQVLREVAQRCQALLCKDQLLARIGGDEFMVACEIDGLEDAQHISRNLMHTLALPIGAVAPPLEVGVSIGMALFPSQGHTVEELLKHADLAMFKAKSLGGGHCQLYEQQMSERLHRRNTLATRLAKALSSDGLHLHYQPKIDLHSGRLTGLEALARWTDPELGPISPGEFIPVAEERGLIVQLGDWALREASRQWAAWSGTTLPMAPPIAVNVSAAQMSDESFPARATQLVHAAGARPAAIELEITETAMMLDPERAQRVAAQLVAVGFSLTIDDFGTGYASMAQLKNFPVGKLKIDMSFVRDMLRAPADMAIVTAVISMARALQLRTVAEGVETPEQACTLKALGCDEAQGYHYAPALPPRLLAAEWLPQPSAQPESK